MMNARGFRERARLFQKREPPDASEFVIFNLNLGRTICLSSASGRSQFEGG